MYVIFIYEIFCAAGMFTVDFVHRAAESGVDFLHIVNCRKYLFDSLFFSLVFSNRHCPFPHQCKQANIVQQAVQEFEHRRLVAVNRVHRFYGVINPVYHRLVFLEMIFQKFVDGVLMYALML